MYIHHVKIVFFDGDTIKRDLSSETPAFKYPELKEFVVAQTGYNRASIADIYYTKDVTKENEVLQGTGN